MTPTDFLDSLAATINDRNTQYGDPADSFGRIAALWTALLGHEVTATDVARCMIALKLSRSLSATDPDSWTDIAGYAAHAAGLAQ